MTTHSFRPPIEKVEFKATVPRGEKQRVFELIGAANGIARTVFFYDTRDLVLHRHHHVYVRARVTEDKNDSTVKLRPLPDLGVPAGWGSRTVGGSRPTWSASGSSSRSSLTARPIRARSKPS